MIGKSRVKMFSNFPKATVQSMLEDQVLPTFVNRTVHEIIWGYDDPLTKMGREFSEGTLKSYVDKSSLS